MFSRHYMKPVIVLLAVIVMGASLSVAGNVNSCQGTALPGNTALGLARKSAGEITQEDVYRTAEKVFGGEPLTQRDIEVLAALSDAVNEFASAGLSEFLTEVVDAHRKKVDSTISVALLQLIAQDAPELPVYESEMRSIVASFPTSKADGHARPYSKGGPIIPIIIGGGICGLSIAACQADADQLLDHCLSGAYCEPDQTVDHGCCQDIYESDIINCYVTCGANGPDGDADACCRWNGGSHGGGGGDS